MSAPKDQTVGQVVSEAKQVLPQVNPDLEKAKSAIDSVLSQVNTQASPELHSRAVALKAGIDSGILNAEQAVTGAQQLIKQFAIPLAVASHLELHGTGAISQAVVQGYRGLQSAMTEAQKLITILKPVLQFLVYVVVIAISFWPHLGAIQIAGNISGGIALSKVIDVLAAWLNVKFSKYPDAPKAELVALPKS